MRHFALILCAVLLTACSGENDRISGSDPKATMDNVQSQLDKAGAEAEARLEDALDDATK